VDDHILRLGDVDLRRHQRVPRQLPAERSRWLREGDLDDLHCFRAGSRRAFLLDRTPEGRGDGVAGVLGAIGVATPSESAGEL